MTTQRTAEIDRTPPEWASARAYIVANEQELRGKYGSNRYLAITPEGVIDYDENRHALARRMETNHVRGSAYPFPLIANIDEAIHPRQLEIPSPEIIEK